MEEQQHQKVQVDVYLVDLPALFVTLTRGVPCVSEASSSSASSPCVRPISLSFSMGDLSEGRMPACKQLGVLVGLDLSDQPHLFFQAMRGRLAPLAGKELLGPLMGKRWRSSNSKGRAV